MGIVLYMCDTRLSKNLLALLFSFRTCAMICGRVDAAVDAGYDSRYVRATTDREE